MKSKRKFVHIALHVALTHGTVGKDNSGTKQWNEAAQQKRGFLNSRFAF